MTPTEVGVVMVLSGATCLGLALYVQLHRQAVASRSLMAIFIGSTIWATFYGLELISDDRWIKEAMGTVKYGGIGLLTASWLIFILKFTGRGRLVTRKTIVALAVEPIAVVLILALPQTHDLVRFYPQEPLDPLPIIEVGPLFWVHLAYQNILGIASTLLLLITFSRIAPQYRRQGWWLAIGYLFPLLPSLAYNFSLGPAAHLDLTPVAIALTGPVLVWGFFRSRLLDIAPIARRHIVENMPDGIIVLDVYLRIVDHNPAACGLLGVETKDLVGLHLGQVLPSISKDLETDQGIRTHKVTVHSTRMLEVENTILSGSESLMATERLAGYLLVLRDATERLANEERLQLLAHFDPLTGLANRKLFADRLGQALAHAKRTGQPFGLLFLDLDRFKVINDTLGHEKGDVLLQQVAERLQTFLRDEDTFARIGGDEFLVLLPEIGNMAGAATVAGKLTDAFKDPFLLDEQDIHVTASIGVAGYPTNGNTDQELMTSADSAMYMAKAHGKNGYCVAGEYEGPLSNHFKFESDLRIAIENNELELFFQPCFTIDGIEANSNRTIYSLEALARWNHPKRGTIPPNIFIPMAEEVGLMPALGRWVLEQSCRQVALWSQTFGQWIAVSINISAAQLPRNQLVNQVNEIFEEYNISPSQLIFELSERIVMNESDPFIGELAALRARGIQLSLDDFGTGHTSLGQLKRMQFDQLKIDQAFIRDLTTDQDNATIVGAMVMLGQALGMHVVAEGVEHASELVILESLGCDAVQGYLTGRPLSADQATEMLAEYVDA